MSEIIEMPNEFTMIAYKPYWVDSCRQCVMERFPSDFQTWTLISRDEVVKEAIALINSQKLRDARYNITLITTWKGKLVTVEDFIEYNNISCSFDLWPCGDSTPDEEKFENYLLEMKNEIKSKIKT
jgi:hypothetical protein